MSNVQSFYMDGNRAMISLGPLSEVKYCAYSCAFCYVQDGFTKYAKLEIDEIVSFLKENIENIRIIYISGDTDSFAKPRTEKAIQLLEILSETFNLNILFTTRTVFTDIQIERIAKVVQRQKEKGKVLFACISISRYFEKQAYLEPNPIPSPDDRINTLIKLKKAGAVSVLALRPFLPVVEVDEYLIILKKTVEFTDIVLGETFYFLRDGNIAKRVFWQTNMSQFEANISDNQRMSFDNNEKNWSAWNSEEYEKIIKAYCEQHSVIFSMHSDEAISMYMNL